MYRNAIDCPVGGTWKHTARNAIIRDKWLIADLEKCDRSFHNSRIALFDGVEYSNIDGDFGIESIVADSIIPKKIFQTHKSLEYVRNYPILRDATESWQQFRDFEYSFSNDADCDEFIKNEFDSNVYNAYQSLPIPILKSDFWRYCVIYHHGGIYADTDTDCLITPYDLILPKKDLILVPENEVHMCQWIFSAKPKHPALKRVIDRMVAKIEEGVDTNEPHFVHKYTGPGMFTNGLKDYFSEVGIPLHSNIMSYENMDQDRIYVHDVSLHQRIRHNFTGWKPDGWLYNLNK